MNQLKREAGIISESGKATKPGHKELKKVVEAVDTAVCHRETTLLVSAQAALWSVADIRALAARGSVSTNLIQILISHGLHVSNTISLTL
ncbi:hypothetical protein [Paraburkholderia aromaticivorans]|uniref:hypothetical protein n=1 Tax=Paraburkholderia aromaticivorans TaxID=2026199 RepID=UPI0014561E1B|nr:hypothetical protein [Paraburkholderia aromaticivorans]